MSTYYCNERTDVLALLPQRSYQSALEIGGGDFPTLLSFARRTGAEAWGVDIRPTQAQGMRFVQGSIEDPAVAAQVPDAYFDVVFANDVLEHLVDTETVLSLLRRKLVPGGLLAISIPNIRQLRSVYHILLRGTFPRNEMGLFDRTHLRWFCKRDMIAMLTASGFEVIDAKSAGRFVRPAFARNVIGELLGLQNLFLTRAA